MNLSWPGPRIALVLLALATSACERSPTENLPGGPLEISLAGRAERGSTIALSVRAGGVPLAATELVWSVSPADAAQLDADGTGKLLHAGEVVFTASVDGRTATLTVIVAVPPAVIFDRMVEGNRDLWKVALDGGELTRLTTDPGDDSDPSVIAGNIAFVSYRDGNAEIYTTTLAGGSERRLTTRSGADLSPALSRDGTRVAFTSDASGVSKVWMLSLEAGDAEAVIPDRDSATDVHASPDWGAEAGTLAFVSTLAGSADILSVTVPGGTPAPLVTGPSAEVEPAWSPSGDRVVFVSNRDGDTELYLFTVATEAVARLTQRTGSDSHPAWLADGRIVYTATDAGTTSLRWLDPAAPEQSFEIPVGGPGAAHPTGVL